MYLYPINFQSKTGINNFKKQNNNLNFKARKNLLGFDTFTASSLFASFPLFKRTPVKIDNIEYNIQKSLKKHKHHPDFCELEQKGFEILASSYFRRGRIYGTPDLKFADVINALRKIFNEEQINHLKENKLKMLIGGIGESQEPFSLLASIKNINGEEKIKDYLDMYIVDLQSQPNKKDLFKQSFYDSIGEPMFVKSSFVNDNGFKYGLAKYREYRVSDEIFEYLSNTYNNDKNSKWETRIQDAFKEYPDNEFSIISVNNTLIYLKDKEEIQEVLNNIYRTLKSGGIFISDNRLKLYKEVFTQENSIEIYPGIYQKL